jgi:hypothetical protein
MKRLYLKGRPPSGMALNLLAPSGKYQVNGCAIALFVEKPTDEPAP